MAPEQSDLYPISHLSVSYSSLSSLNTFDVHLPHSSNFTEDLSKYWIIYIHGGAWRDPTVTSTSIEPCLRYLSPQTLPIAGAASINYRLSPYPNHPNDPSSPEDSARNVKHPAHVEDVLTAITFLQNKYGFGDRYVLVGHSCGATLAMQVVMRLWDAGSGNMDNAEGFKMPMAVLGVEGIYDLGLLVASYRDIPMYRDFVERAFGTDEADWQRASPVSGEFDKTWKNGKVVLVGWSLEDELVDQKQSDHLMVALGKHKIDTRADLKINLKGHHDDIWQKGVQLAAAIKLILAIIAQ